MHLIPLLLIGGIPLGVFIFGIGIPLIILIILLFAWFKIVPNGFAHVVVSPRKKIVASPDDKVLEACKSRNNKIVTKRAYYAIPSGFPGIGRTIRRLNVAIRELTTRQETIERNQARYQVSSSLKYRIVDVLTAAETFTNDSDLEAQLTEVVLASVRAVTVKYDVTEARAKKQEMSRGIEEEIVDDLAQWGLQLVSFQLVDFQDTETSTIISDISKRREAEIRSRTRQENAEKEKEARIKEAEANELAESREIQAREAVDVRDEERQQKVAMQKKITQENLFEVKRVEEVKQAEINKDKAIVKAQEERATSEILKEKLHLDGEGIRLKAEQQAIADAAPIRERGKAEAEAKEMLQAALNKFTTTAINALTAEQQIEASKEVGMALAMALEKADLRVFMGGENGKQGFDLGSLVAATGVADPGLMTSLLNKMARPNDLGFTGLIKNEEESDPRNPMPKKPNKS